MTGIFPDSFLAIANATALGIIFNIVILMLAAPEGAMSEDLELED
jgi:hypothetical protein